MYVKTEAVMFDLILDASSTQNNNIIFLLSLVGELKLVNIALFVVGTYQTIIKEWNFVENVQSELSLIL